MILTDAHPFDHVPASSIRPLPRTSSRMSSSPIT
jgi:hypothetical protein